MAGGEHEFVAIRVLGAPVVVTEAAELSPDEV
jgi:hypothetical protein